MTTVYIDKYGKVVEQDKAAHKVTLSGSYSYSQYFKEYRHGIKSIDPKIPFSVLTHATLLVNP